MPANNQLATWSDMTTAGVVYINGGPPAGAAMIDASGFNTYIQNDGAYPWGYASNQCMSFGDMQAHKVTTSQHTGTMNPGSGNIYTHHVISPPADSATSPEIVTGTTTPSALAPSSTTPMTIALSIPAFPITGTGSSGTVNGEVVAQLLDPSSAVIATFTTTGTTLSGSYSTPGSANGVYTWNIYATWDYSDGTVAFGTAHLISWTGTYTYYA